jgi:DNA-binding response OmpR family regulator
MSLDPQAPLDAHGGDAIYEQLLSILAEGSRTQLGLIQETTRELLESADPAQRSLLERVRQGVWELGTLVSDISDLYAYSSGRLNEADSDFDLRVTLEGVRSRLSRTQPQAGWMAISRIRHDVPPLLEGKPARLQDILLGVTAAMVPTWPEGTLRIEVCKSWEREGVIELVFRCEFRPAQPPASEQVESLRSRLAAAGESPVIARHDLRLQLAQRLAIAGGGSLSPGAPEDGALSFELRMPFAMRSVPESAPESGPPLTLHGRRALICDGSESRRSRLAAILGLWGLQTEMCGTSQAVLETLRDAAAQGRPFDIALVDSELQDTDGATMGRLIREDLAYQATRLMMLFGVGLRGDAKLAEDTGYEAYLPRTISIHELREALIVLLKRGGDDSKRAPIVTQHSLADVRLEGVRVLLVSADPVGALVLEAVLRRKGFSVDRIGHVADGAERCEKTRYDFLILDLAQMSEQDVAMATGLRVLLDEHGPTPIAVLVERPDSDENRGLEGLAPNAVFTKPVNLEDICAFCEGSLYPELAAAPVPPRPSRAATVFVVSNAPGEGEPVVFERGCLGEMTMGIESLQLSVVESYLDDMPRRVEAIATAVMAGDVVTAERDVLSARALALAIGAMATAHCLGALGQQLEQRRLEEAQFMLARLRAESEKSLGVLRAEHLSMKQEKPAA